MIDYTDYFGDVIHFHIDKGLTVGRLPHSPQMEVIDLRTRLIEEESEELLNAIADGDISHIAKELADLLYVCFGTAVSYGIDMDKVWDEVHYSNMTKDALPSDIPSWSKVPKGPSYQAPDIAEIVGRGDPLVANCEVRS